MTDPIVVLSAKQPVSAHAGAPLALTFIGTPVDADGNPVDPALLTDFAVQIRDSNRELVEFEDPVTINDSENGTTFAVSLELTAAQTGELGSGRFTVQILANYDGDGPHGLLAVVLQLHPFGAGAPSTSAEIPVSVTIGAVTITGTVMIGAVAEAAAVAAGLAAEIATRAAADATLTAAVAAETVARAAADTALSAGKVDKATLTTDGDVLTRAAGVPARITRDGLAQDSAFTSRFEPLGTAVLKSLYDANTILSADVDNTPTALTVAASRILGRKSSGGIAALTPAEVLAEMQTVLDARYKAEVYVTDAAYGAVADARRLGDSTQTAGATMTSGSAVLTASLGAFTSADVGKTIVVTGAGAAGAKLKTTVLSRQSATQITLATTAGTSVTNVGAVLGTDNGPAFQLAFNAVATAGGGTVMVPPGLFLIATAVTKNFINLASDVRFAGVGSSSQIILATLATVDAFELFNLERCTVEGLMFVGVHQEVTDTNRVLYFGSNGRTVLRDCGFYGLCVSATDAAVVYCSTGEFVMERTAFLGCSAHGGLELNVVHVTNWTGVKVADCWFIDYGTLDGSFITKTGLRTARAWIFIGDAFGGLTRTSALAQGRIDISQCVLDEGANFGVHINPNDAVSKTADSIHIHGINVNVGGGVGTAGVRIRGAERVLIEQSWFGYSAASGSSQAIDMINAGDVTLNGVIATGNAPRIQADSTTRTLHLIKCTYTTLTTSSPTVVTLDFPFQPLDTDLTAIAALTSAANKVPYSTGVGTWALADLSAVARTVLDDTTLIAMLATLGAPARSPVSQITTHGNDRIGADASFVVAAANDAYSVLFTPDRDILVTAMRWSSGTAGSAGNYDIGLFTAARVCLWSKGSTAFPAPNTVVKTVVNGGTGIQLSAGVQYYAVIATDTGTNTFRGLETAGNFQSFQADGTLRAQRSTSSFPLPTVGNSITFAVGSARIPLIIMCTD